MHEKQRMEERNQLVKRENKHSITIIERKKIASIAVRVYAKAYPKNRKRMIPC
jgi:hypothetical protein